MLDTELRTIELTDELYHLTLLTPFEDLLDSLEEALRRRAGDEETDDRWQTTAEELRDLRRRDYEPLEKEFISPGDQDPAVVSVEDLGDYKKTGMITVADSPDTEEDLKEAA